MQTSKQEEEQSLLKNRLRTWFNFTQQDQGHRALDKLILFISLSKEEPGFHTSESYCKLCVSLALSPSFYQACLLSGI